MADAVAAPQANPGEQRIRAPGPMAALRGEFANPLFRNAYALIANGGLTGVLGLGYWTLGAKLYSPGDVGRNWAEIQAIMFVGGVTMLNFLLVRFIPQTARRTRSLVWMCYATGSGAAALLAACFLLTLDYWGTSLRHLHGWGAGLWFVAMAVSWNIFNQQEGVFTGLRRAGWVPVVNTAFGVAKLVLLVCLAAALPHDGVVISWFVPVMVALIPVNAVIFGRLIPAHTERNEGRGFRATRGEMVRYLGGGYLGGIFQYAAISLIPVVVAAHLDAAAGAYFQMAWALGMMLDLLALTLALSLTVEGAFDDSTLAESARAALRRTFTLLIPVIVLVVASAPIVLGCYGHGYAATGAPLLQLLAVATLPKALIELYIGVLRVRSRTRLIALIQGARFAGMLALVLIFMDPARLYTVGLGVLGVSLTVAALVLPSLLGAAAPTKGSAAQGGCDGDRAPPPDRHIR